MEKNKKDVLFLTEVQAGTYIRKLIHDLGLKINGAHMLELRRVKASIFEEPSISIYDFLEAVEEYKKGNESKLKKMLIPGEIISKVLPVVQVKKEFVKKLHHGYPLIKEYLKQTYNQKEGKIAVFENESFIGVFSLIDNKEILAKPEFVLQPIKK